MRVTLNNINARLAAKNLPFEIVRGNGYFYFVPLNDNAGEIPSIFSMHLSAMQVSEYVEHVAEHYAPTQPESLGLVKSGRVYMVDGFEVKEYQPAQWQVAIVWGWGKESIFPAATHGEALEIFQTKISLRPDLMDRIELRSADLTRKIWVAEYSDFQNAMLLHKEREAA